MVKLTIVRMAYLHQLAVVFLLGLNFSYSVSPPPQEIVHRLKPNGEPGVKKHFEDKNDVGQQLQIFCREGDPKWLQYYFRSVMLRIESSAEDIRIIKGSNEFDVYYKYLSTTNWFVWAANLLPWRVREVSLPAFNSSCVGVLTSKRYTASLLTRSIDPWNLALFVAGAALFIFAPGLAKSTAFFYTSGTLLGAVAALLIILYILSRSLPKGKFSYITIGIVWPVCLYFAGESWNRMEELFQDKLQYILVYLTIGSLIAFITCYRMGPPSHPKTLDIIRWSLQGVSLWLIHMSSELVEVSTTIIICILLAYNFAAQFIRSGKMIWRRVFPAQVRLLTEEEYIAQGTQETKKGLEQLREYCSSPECNSWKIVSRLKDPRRFASFMDGSSHLSDEELMSFESFMPMEDSSDEVDSDQEAEVRNQVAAAPGRQGTPRPPPPNQSNGTRSLRSSSKVKAPINEYLTDDDSPNNTLHTDDED